jgi:hypoxanthine phosphoribosyltransferase
MTYKKLANSTEVKNSISRLAEAIIEHHPTTPLFISLLKGAAPFSSLLMLEIVRQSQEYHPELDYMMVSTYGAERHAGEPHVVTDLAPSTLVSGRDVVVIDDVLDKGITADFVMNHVKNRGAANVKLAVLCDKQTERERDVTADYVGFTLKDNWLVGMGMDDASTTKEGYRWLDEIWEIAR